MPDDHAFEPPERQSDLIAPPAEQAKKSGFDPGEGWYLLVFLAGLAGWILLALITWMSIN